MKDYSLQDYSGKTVLVTGDTGFKGSWLALWLSKLGADVTGLGLPPVTCDDNYVVTGLESKIHHIDGDIRDSNITSKIIQEIHPDFIFHLASQALVLDSYRDPHHTFTTNIVGTLNVLEAIRNNPSVKAGVMITSDKCYENRGWIYGYRESDPLGGRDPYSASKGAAELVISSYIRSYFTEENTPSLASVRAGNVIGGGDWAKDRIVPDTIRSLMKQEPVHIRNPHAVRPWQYVLEPLYGYLLLGSALLKDKKTYSGAWNFGPHYENAVSVKTLVKEILRQWGSGSYSIESSQNTAGESSILMLDISKAVQVLGWNPCLSLYESIRLTLDEYRVIDLMKQETYHQRSRHIDEYMKLREDRELEIRHIYD
jgi:CDP-glucose 4,6-dehydratase